MWGHPDQTEGPLAFAEKREPMAPSTAAESDHEHELLDYEPLMLERHGPVGWLINNRPDQLNAMNSAHARRVRRRLDRARRRPRRCA